MKWWTENYGINKKTPKHGDTDKSELSKQIAAERGRRELKRLETERIKAGGSRYTKENLNEETVRNCEKEKDLQDMVRALDLTTETDWKWRKLCADKETAADEISKRKGKFLQQFVISYLAPPVDETILKTCKAFCDFDVSARCAVCDLCGLQFFWANEKALESLFTKMSTKGTRIASYSEKLSRACEVFRTEKEELANVLDYSQFLGFMTCVYEKYLGLRDWVGFDEGGVRKPDMNNTFNYQVGRAKLLVEQMFNPDQGNNGQPIETTHRESVRSITNF